MQLEPPFRKLDLERDRDAVIRIWREVGWLKKEDEEELIRYLPAARALVAEMAGQAECLVLTTPGTLRYQDEDLPFTCVTGVTTSRVARGQRFASRLTASAVAADALDGALVIGLGMFEQGFYNRLGFGSGEFGLGYCDPATGLAATDELSGPPELLAALDDAFRLPEPHPDWPF